MIRIVLLVGALALCVVTAVAVYGLLGRALSIPRIGTDALDQPVSEDRKVVPFVIQPGQSAQTIGDELQAQGLIRSSLAFKLMVEARGVGGQLAAGEYELSPAMKTSDIVDRLASGVTRRGRLLVVPEGLRGFEIARRLDESRLMAGDEFLEAVRQLAAGAPLVPQDQSMEGYLFPDSYEIGPSTSPSSLAKLMYESFERRFHPDMRRRANERGLSVHEAVTLASIIEREAMVPAERPLVSAVFHNRLRAGMRLQADPTVQFALANRDLSEALRLGFWKRDLVQVDLQIPSPYNTYAVAGLPPGPICNPGLDSLTAAVYPAPVDYLYFVARGDGSHAFARTDEEHRTNVAQFR